MLCLCYAYAFVAAVAGTDPDPILCYACVKVQTGTTDTMLCYAYVKALDVIRLANQIGVHSRD